MSNKKTIPTISSSEASKMSVSALAVRPNDASRFGQGGLSATALQEWFDKLPNLVTKKLNDIAEVLASDEAAKYIGTDALGVDNLYDFLLLFGPRGTGLNDKNISDYIETLYAPLGESTEKSVALKDIVSDIARRLVDASAGHVVDAHLDSVTNTLVITFADGTDARVDLSPLAAGVGVQGEIDRLKETDADFERRLSNIEEHISDDYFVTDETVAYEKAVPARACSSAKLMSLGGMTYRDEETNTLKDSKVSEIKNYGANILDGSKFVEGSFSVRGITYSYDADTQIYTINGTMDSSGNLAQKGIILKGQKGSTYILRTEVVSGSATIPSGGNALIYFGSTDSITDGYTNWHSCGLATSQVKSKVLPHEYISNVWFYFTQGVVFNNLKVKIMLAETTDTSLPYKPYREPISYPIPTEIQVGKGINGYVDTIGFEAKKRTQRVNTVVFTGNEIFSAGGYYFITTTLNVPKGAGTYAVMISEKFPVCFSNAQLNNFQFGSTDSIFNYFADLNAFKAYLAERYASGNPVTIIYALEEPIEIDISAELEGFDNIIEVEGGGSLEFVNEYKNPVPSAVKYLLKEESAV